MARQRALERRPPIEAYTREAIRARTRAGDGYRDIARAFDMSYGIVSNTAVRMGTKRKAPSPGAGAIHATAARGEDAA